MANKGYSLFRRFIDAQQAQELATLLKENGVAVYLEDNSPSFDVSFAGNQVESEIQVMVKQSDFPKAQALLEVSPETLKELVPKDHYLYKFSNSELYEILMKPDEWGDLDYQLAQQILKERGQKVDPALMETLKKQRLKDLKEPQPRQTALISAGYLFTLLGGFIGIFIGWYLWTAKRTLPNGEKVFIFEKQDRVQGSTLLVFGLIMMLIYLTLQLSIGLL
ncbi:MAG: hypothetical protein AAFU64_01890 [Bacteroidota bacterium]